MPHETHAQFACLEYLKPSYYAPGICSSSRSTGTATPDLLSDASSQASWRPVNSQSSAQTTPDSVSANLQPSLLSAPHLGALQDQVNLVDVTSWRDGVEREAVALPPALRLNARRSRPRLDGQTCPPSTLVRQPERRLCFVSSLVVFAAGLISAIWPLSSPVLHDTHYAHSVLPLQDFITETLRRSKTSYSTLQVAMFYLILLKDKLPKCDFTQEQQAGGCRAMQCGRRMFLSALMLASKFLQDRNYSTRAWGKITGLPTLEINRNELNFLEAVEWKLHVSKEKFERWSHIVISLCGPPPPGARSIQPSLVETLGWTFALERLRADCAEDFSAFRDQSANFGYALKQADWFGLLTPPSSPPDTTSDQGESLGEEEKLEHVEESSATPLAPPPAPYQANLPTPRGTPRLPQSQCSTYVPDNRCRESASALAMLKFSARPASRELCPPPSKPCPASNLRTQSRRSSISSCVSSAISVSTSNSSPPSLCSDLSSMPSRSRSSSISETDAMAHLRAQSSERAMKLPWVSSPKYSTLPGSDCSSSVGASLGLEGTIALPASEPEPARYVFPVRSHPGGPSHTTQPVVYDEGAKRSAMRRSSKMKKRTHSKTDICGLVNIPEDDVQSMVRKELMADLHQSHSVAAPWIDPMDDSRGNTDCKRNRRTTEHTAAADHARILLRKQCLAKRMMPCRRRISSQTSTQTAVYALGR